MIYTTNAHPPGVLGVSCQEAARYSAFAAAWSGLQAPVGSIECWGMGYDTASNSNNVIRGGMIETDVAKGGHPRAPEMQWVFLMDDDHVFPADTLVKLLDRNVDVVMPLYAQRRPPNWPCIFKERTGKDGYPIYTWPELKGKKGLMLVASAGKGGVLIRRHVLEKIAPDWIRDPLSGPAPFDWLGKVGEDHSFYQRCRDAGFGVFVDLDLRMPHLTICQIQPHQNEAGDWCPEVDLYNGQTIRLWPEAGETPAP